MTPEDRQFISDLLDQKLSPLRSDFDEKFRVVESSLKKLTRRVRDIESDQHTMEAIIARFVSDSGISFTPKDMIPYPMPEGVFHSIDRSDY